MGKTFLSHFKFFKRTSQVSVLFEEIDEHVYFFPPSIPSTQSSVYFTKNSEIFLPPQNSPIPSENIRSDSNRIEFLSLINLANLVNFNLSNLNLFELQYNPIAIREVSKIFQFLIDNNFKFKNKRKNKKFFKFFN